MRVVLFFFICACLASCFSEGDCLISATNYMHIQFRKKSNTALDSAVAMTSIAVSGTDSIFVFKNDTTFHEILLPVDIHNISTTFIFARQSLTDASVTAVDTMQIGYTPQSKIISKECGAFTFYKDLKILKTNLSSTQIKTLSTSLIKDPTSSGTSAYAINYQIYY
jgi:hypothetical protein